MTTTDELGPRRGDKVLFLEQGIERTIQSVARIDGVVYLHLGTESPVPIDDIRRSREPNTWIYTGHSKP
jgi:hypothetical protein